jgi:hypothetical protein
MSPASRTAARRWQLDPMILAVGALLLIAEAAFVVVALESGEVIVQNPLLVLGVPFVWINLSLLVFGFVRPAPESERSWVSTAIAVGYFAVLAVAGGLLVWNSAGGSGVRMTLQGVPGWIPLVIAGLGPISVIVVPFKLVGYAALTYLVYVTVRDASGAALGGLLGLLSCVSCTLPVIAALVSGLAGGGAAVAAAAYANSYALSTVVFAVTIGLLVWRPTMADLRLG